VIFQFSSLLDQIPRAIAARQPQAPPAVILPARVTAVPSPTADTAPNLRDRHLEVIQQRGRLGGQKTVDYGKRALVETALFRYQTLMGPRLRARTLPAQKSEARMACSAIHRMTQLGMPISQRVR
jgi:hypothetical protein